METLQHMIMVQYNSGDDGDLLTALNLTDERVKEIMGMMSEDIKIEGKRVKEEGGDMLAFNSLKHLIDHIKNGDLSGADLLFMIHVAYVEARASKRHEKSTREGGIQIGYKAAKDGIPLELATALAALIGGQNGSEVELGDGFFAEDSTDWKEQAKKMADKYKTRGATPEGEGK